MKQIFINLPADDLDKSVRFYAALGFIINPLFTDKDQRCLIWSDSIYVMLQSRAFSNSYIQRQVLDVSAHQIPSFTLPGKSVEWVNEMMDHGLKAGGKEPVPAISEDFMYLRSLEDPDGYLWGILYLEHTKFNDFKKSNP